MNKRIAVLFLAMILALSAGAEVYKWVDDPHPDWVVEATKVQRAGYSHHNFELRLRPGEYVISAIEIQAKSLWPKSIDIPAGGPSFTVPENSCVYLGPVEWVYPMFPPRVPRAGNGTSGGYCS